MSVSYPTLRSAAAVGERRAAGSDSEFVPLPASVSVVIPTLNEAANLPHVLALIPSIVD